MKHCSKQVHDILIPLIKNLEIEPAKHLLSLVSLLDPGAHTEQVGARIPRTHTHTHTHTHKEQVGARTPQTHTRSTWVHAYLTHTRRHKPIAATTKASISGQLQLIRHGW